MMKASRIVAIFLKDRNTSHELARSVLQFLKISINLLNEDLLKGDQGILKIFIDNLFSQKLSYHVKKHKLIVRKIIQKLITKFGPNYVSKIMPEFHRPMVSYLEKVKRKEKNKKNKAKLLDILYNGEAQDGVSDDNSSDSDEDKDSEDSESDDDQDKRKNQNPGRGADILQANPSYDIPEANDIPIISKLSKQDKLDQLDGMQQAEQLLKKKRAQINKVVEDDEDNLETHFVENPFIKIRERAAQKLRDGKVMIGEKQLEDQDEDMNNNEDVYIVQESGKMIVQDLELRE